MDRILVDKALIKEAMDTIADKNAQLEKLAAQVQELSIYRRVVDMVAKGQIDPADTLFKVAEFIQNPDSLYLLEKRAGLRWDSCVTLIESTGAQSTPKDAQDLYTQDLESILSDGKE